MSSTTIAPIDPQYYPNSTVEGCVDLGNMGDTSEPAINSAGVPFVLDKAIKPYTLDHCRVFHEGLGSGAPHVVKFRLYRLPSTVAATVAECTAGRLISDTLSTSATTPTNLTFSFSAISETARRVGENEKFVLLVSSDDDSQAGTTIDGIVVSWLGRNQIL